MPENNGAHMDLLMKMQEMGEQLRRQFDEGRRERFEQIQRVSVQIAHVEEKLVGLPCGAQAGRLTELETSVNQAKGAARALHVAWGVIGGGSLVGVILFLLKLAGH